MENFYQTTLHDITNNSAFYGSPFLKEQAVINGIETFTHKIAELLLEKLQFSLQMRHEYNSDNFVKWRNVYRIKKIRVQKSYFENTWLVYYLKNFLSVILNFCRYENQAFARLGHYTMPIGR